MTTPNGYTCRICGVALTGLRRKLCPSRECANTARHELRARFAPGGARGKVGRPVFYYLVVRENDQFPVGKIFAAAQINAEIRAGRLDKDCFKAYQEVRQ
jgi:hypothetical protein